MPKPFLLAATLCVLLISCFNNKNKGIKTAPAFKQSPLDSAYATLRPAIQTFTINNSKVSRIKAKNGTEILIPADCLVSANGDKVENIQLEIVEAFSLPEFVTSGLATMSNGRLLISNGMVYINARSGNENLQLKEGASLTVSMPTMTKSDGFQLFTGDGSNWTPDSAMTETDYIMPLPLDLLYPEGKNFFWYCASDAGGPNVIYHLLDTNIVDILNSKYENTVIATEEFKQRYWHLFYMMENMSYFVNRDYYFKNFNITEQKFNYDIWKVYLDHPERSLRESDSIAKKTYIDYFNTNKEKIAAFCDEANVYARNYYDNWTDTNYVFDFRKQSLEEFFMVTLLGFPSEAKPSKVINDHGVNLDAVNAFEQLAAKGVDKNEIIQIMEYHFRRQAKINKLKSIKEAIVNKDKLNKVFETTLFTVKKLGWINCDQFYDDPTAGKALMYVSNSSRNTLDYTDYSLIIPSLNVRLSAFQDSSGKFTFTQKNGDYTKLPIGREAVIIGVSLQHDSLFYAGQKIKIADELNTGLAMSYINKNSLKDSLQVALKN